MDKDVKVEEAVKQYPFEEDDKAFEQQIVDAIKKLPLEQRILAIALNNYVLAKKQSESITGNQIEKINDRYLKLQEPFMNKINQVIAGERALDEEEVNYAKAHLTPEEVPQVDQNLAVEPIADYWFKVLTSCVRLQNDIFEVDHPLLKKITKIESVPEENSLNFTIVFHFAPNEYFDNSSLSARFIVNEEEVADKIEGATINWKEGKDFTKKTITKKKKNKKTGKKVNVTKTIDADSFFNLFQSIDAPSGDDKEDDNEEINERMQKLQERYDIASTLQEEILLYHLEYYLGLRKGDEDYDMPMEGEELDDDDDEDDVPSRPVPNKKLSKK